MPIKQPLSAVQSALLGASGKAGLCAAPFKGCWLTPANPFFWHVNRHSGVLTALMTAGGASHGWHSAAAEACQAKWASTSDSTVSHQRRRAVRTRASELFPGEVDVAPPCPPSALTGHRRRQAAPPNHLGCLAQQLHLVEASHSSDRVNPLAVGPKGFGLDIAFA